MEIFLPANLILSPRRPVKCMSGFRDCHRFFFDQKLLERLMDVPGKQRETRQEREAEDLLEIEISLFGQAQAG